MTGCEKCNNAYCETCMYSRITSAKQILRVLEDCLTWRNENAARNVQNRMNRVNRMNKT
jgi:hypothetical protein